MIELLEKLGEKAQITIINNLPIQRFPPIYRKWGVVIYTPPHRTAINWADTLEEAVNAAFQIYQNETKSNSSLKAEAGK